MKEKDNLMKEKEFTDAFIKNLHSLEKELRKIEEAKGNDDKTKEKEIVEILKRNLPFFEKMEEEIEKAKKKYTRLILIL